MLNPAYQALSRIQSKISNIRTLEELKALMLEEAFSPTTSVYPSMVWTLDIKALDQTSTSIRELGFRPLLTEGYKTKEDHLIKIENTDSLGLFAMQEAFIKTLERNL